ncbi:MAG: TlpA family protein disulfide reductase [Myxococcales bacterium]|nr:TlpA family protein disulfide reductase [Myxococcales bacterium]
MNTSGEASEPASELASGPAVPVPPARDRGAFPARVGALLVQPLRAFREIEHEGKGLRDAVLLALLGIVCFWLRDVAEAVLGLAHLPLVDVVVRLWTLVGMAFREAVVVVLPASLALTVLAGQGRRDPSRDLELGAACYVPYFTVNAALRAAEGLLGPSSYPTHRAVKLMAFAAAGLWFALALRVARQRPSSSESAPVLRPTGGAGVRVAATALAVVLGVALFANALWVVQNTHVVKPFSAGERVPTFSLERVNGPGGRVSLEDLRGKVVLLDFWASWCHPCLKLAPVLHALHEDWSRRGFEVVSINTDLSPPELRDFLEKNPAPYPVVVSDGAGRVEAQYKVVNLPHLVILDRQGHAAQTFWGYKSRAQLEEVIARLVTTAPSP